MRFSLNSFGSLVLGLLIAALPLPSFAFNPADLDKLLAGEGCPRCDLSEANLEGANLEGTNLSGADLTGAVFDRPGGFE